MENVNFSVLTVEDTLKKLTTAKDGLSEEEVKKRQLEYGKNALSEKKKPSFIKIFMRQLNDPMIFVLFGAIVITVGLSIYETVKWIASGNKFDFFTVGDWPDVIIIFAVIFLNALIGTIQEIKAETSLAALKKLATSDVHVMRSGKRLTIPSTELVPGDIIFLEQGDTVGADLRLLEAVNLKVDEAALTGESFSVLKEHNLVFSSDVSLGDRLNCCYMSTVVTYGRGRGIVTATGMNTEIGKVAGQLIVPDEKTPLQKVLAKLSKLLGILSLAIIVIVFIVDMIWILYKHGTLPLSEITEAILASVSLAVAAIPEGLPAVVTIVLAIGVQRMVKTNAIVRKLPSVETLGSVSVICSDKTGTLTENKMRVEGAYCNKQRFDTFAPESFAALKLLASGMSLCSDATVDEGISGDPTEVALVEFANTVGLKKAYLESICPRIGELPFDSIRKMMSTMHRAKDETVVFTKGALDVIVSHTKYIYQNGCIRPIDKDDIEDIYRVNGYFTDNALRVLALAMQKRDKITEDELIFIGMVAMSDPVREEAKASVATLKAAGITTIMITGDHIATAYAVAKKLGIAEKKEDCCLGCELDRLSSEEIRELVKTTRVFARVSPQNKVQIVKAFKENRQICAMTGDGVNDAPSLKAADIGIAMGITGTDVAKDASDMILADDNFASIEKAVAEGRGIYANIKKTVYFLLGSNIAEILAMFILILIGLPAPFLAIHLLWINLVTDSLPAIALGMQPKDKRIMQEHPRKSNESIFAAGGFALTFGYGAVITVAVILAYLLTGMQNRCFLIKDITNLYETDISLKQQAQTMAFMTLAFSELFHMLGMSNTNETFLRAFFARNKMLIAAFVTGICLQLAVAFIPFMQKVFQTENIAPLNWLYVVCLALLPLLIHETVYYIKKRKR